MKTLKIISPTIGAILLIAYIGNTTISCNNKPAKKTEAERIVINTGSGLITTGNFPPVDSTCIRRAYEDSLQISFLNEQLTEVVVQLNGAGMNNEKLWQEVQGLKRRNDSLHEDAAVSKLKLKRVENYYNIVIKNPKNEVFLKGWIARALRE